MKTSASFFAVVASLMPTLTMGFIAAPWSISNVPSSGLKDITFPFSLANAPHKTGYLFHQQFNFNGQPDAGYTGFQPRPDAKGKPVLHIDFATYIPSARTDDKNCSPGADGRPGVSCSVEFSGSYNHTYDLEIRNTGGTTWVETAIDTTTKQRIHVGSYTLPKGTGGVLGARDSSIEFRPWVVGSSCSLLPKTAVVFGTPKTSTPGAGAGNVGDGWEFGDCFQTEDFTTQTSAKGVEIHLGLAA
ncbi:hypothetical protein BDZ94DRAFT_1263089 [Collybia nuda]|uniref:Uncharacterized protein n=1 Tax=Collybia nuda TaxID=64659 RepID=A0A9P5Y3M6_9AGAR|nr:hypothetical protein BDZ94DRAFT_1263089 [Collybia nuda]